MATRVIAELGAAVVKTYYCEPGFEKVTHACPVPILIAGGKKLPELEALEMAWKALDQGAAGVDMGRNVFQADDPVAMVQAVRAKLRAIAMITVAAILGMMPLAVGTGLGSEVRIGIGIASIGGIAISSVLTVLILPALYLVFVPRAPRT